MKIIELINNPKYKEKFVMQKLIYHHTKISREEIWTHTENNLPEDITQKILLDYSKYADDTMPMEYILGYVEFFDNKFKVTQDTLIPRPETEYMIEAVTEHIKKLNLNKNNANSENNLLLDIGTGCGVLGTSVLRQNPDIFKQTIFTDIADETLAVAQENFNTYFPKPEFKINFLNTSLLDFIIKQEINIDLDNFDHIILISNAPYIPDLTLDTEVQANVLKREPRIALVGGKDGLDLYRIMLKQLIQLKPNNISIFFEMMARQVDILSKEFGTHFNFSEVKTFHANIRIIYCEFKA